MPFTEILDVSLRYYRAHNSLKLHNYATARTFSFMAEYCHSTESQRFYGGLFISTVLPTTGFLRLPQVLAIVPISKSAWWKGCRTGRYPKPVKLGPRTTAWRAEDIAALIASFSDQNNAADHKSR